MKELRNPTIKAKKVLDESENSSAEQENGIRFRVSPEVVENAKESVMEGQTMFRMIDHDEAVLIADDFAKKYKGAAKRVVVS